MGLFDIFKKDKTKNQQVKRDLKKFECDKSKYQWDSAAKEYCSKFSKKYEDLTEKDKKIIWGYAGNHIAFFITWIIQNNYISSMHADEKDDIEAVKNEKLNGTDFLMNNCDGVLSREDLSDEILEFVDSYYDEHYLNDYCICMEDRLHRTVLGTGFSWEDYNNFKYVIDNAYTNYKKENI